MRRPAWRRSRLRTVLAVVMPLAVLLGGLRMLERRGRVVRDQGQVRAWAGQRNKYQQLAELARSKGDMAGAETWDELAVYADGWRRVFEYRAAGGEPGHEPPIPRDPLLPPPLKQPELLTSPVNGAVSSKRSGAIDRKAVIEGWRRGCLSLGSAVGWVAQV